MLHVISGPTAVGKTGFALDYAIARGAEIVSCDASQVYRGMDIGTAKPTAEERARVPHHLIDIVAIDQPYDIRRYIEDAREAVESIIRRGREVVVTGGSGFYLKSFFAPVVDTIEVPGTVAREVAILFEERGLEGLLERLRELNPEGTGNLDVRNPRRVIKALERCVASGRPLAELAREFENRRGAFDDFSKHFILLERDPGELKERIAARVQRMLEAGLIDEVRRLRGLGIEKNRSAASAIGYRETLRFIDGGLGREELAEAITTDTRQLARKQRIWFRTQVREPDERINLSELPA